jgi:hypothetical protein
MAASGTNNAAGTSPNKAFHGGGAPLIKHAWKRPAPRDTGLPGRRGAEEVRAKGLAYMGFGGGGGERNGDRGRLRA